MLLEQYYQTRPNCSLHAKKTNNTNKLSFCPYKNLRITKLKKKKAFFLVPADI